MPRAYNFSAGPATLPLEVLAEVQDAFLDWENQGASILEISHRSAAFDEVADASVAAFRALLSIPDNYHVLFMPAGGRGQFSMVPMNLLGGKRKAAYVNTGLWGSLSHEEAMHYCDAQVVASGEPDQFRSIPAQSTWADFSDAAYLYTVDNETINGVEFPFIPETGDVPLVSDMSSNLLSRPFDINRYGLIFACAQKNIGPAGITVVIIRDDLLAREPIRDTPAMFRYKNHADNRSFFNTPPTFAWYVCGLVLKWVQREGGVSVMAERSARKSAKLYACIDQSDFYQNQVDLAVRSRMNVPFTLADAALDGVFLQEAKAAGLIGLKGHRYVGGMRASLYNAMPEEGVDALVTFMQDFERRHG